MRSWIETGHDTVEDPRASLVAELVAEATPFWLDIESPTDEIIDHLATGLKLHPLAVEDSKEFGQRGKLEIYGDVAMLVGFGIDPSTGDPIEVHSYFTAGFLITLHRTPSAALDRVRRHESVRPLLLSGDPVKVLHHLVSALHDDFPVVVAQLDERLSAFEAKLLQKPDDRLLVDVATVQGRASLLRRTLSPWRDLSARSALVDTLPGATEDSRLYASDISDELHQTVADLTAIGERCVSALALHASLSSNRQGQASRQLTAVATIFLPITFLVGFFGQNFSVLTETIEQGWPAFLFFGLFLNVVCVVVTVWWLRRRGLR